MSATVCSIQTFINEHNPDHAAQITARFANKKDPDKLIRFIIMYCANNDKKTISLVQKAKQELREAQKLGKELCEKSQRILGYYTYTSHLIFNHDENERYTSVNINAWAEGLTDNNNNLLNPLDIEPI